MHFSEFGTFLIAPREYGMSAEYNWIYLFMAAVCCEVVIRWSGPQVRSSFANLNCADPSFRSQRKKICLSCALVAVSCEVSVPLFGSREISRSTKESWFKLPMGKVILREEFFGISQCACRNFSNLSASTRNWDVNVKNFGSSCA